jgi:membrane protein
VRRALAFGVFARRRYIRDKCLRAAASLSYTSLLALVPVAAIGFTMLSAFPVFAEFEEQIQDFIFENLMPETINVAQEYFNDFIDNASKMTVPGIIGLSITAMLLLASVESAINTIFRVSKNRRFASRLTMYWTIITLGPILLGASFSLSSYIISMTQGADGGGDFLAGIAGRLVRALPAVMTMVAFTLFYAVVPNRPVRWGYAVLGGVVAGGLFSALRWGFGIYLIYVPTYQTIYGAMAIIPIFLVWMYLCWAVILFGAEIVASLVDWEKIESRLVGIQKVDPV